jgi:uncharacterized protein (TIGR02231 family)
MNIAIKTEVKSVTVYPDRAMITIQGSINLAAGSHRVIFDELPIYMDTDSVRARGQAEMATRLLGVDVMPVFYEESPAVDVAHLVDQIEKVKDELHVLDDESETHTAHTEFINGIRQATDRFAQGLSRGKSTVEDQRELTNFLYEQDRDTKASLRKINIDKRDLKSKLAKLQKELNERGSSKPMKRMRATVGLESDGDGEVTLELMYLVSHAGWKPLYDLRLSGENGNNSVELTAYAEIAQESGQEWSDMELSVSTARPAVAQRMPELNPWYIDTYRPPSPPVYREARPAAQPLSVGEPMVQSQALVATAADPILADLVTASVESTGSAVTFRIKGRSDIPSDGSTHKKVIATYYLDPNIDYLTIPKHTSAVFRRIKMINETPAPLLPGKSNLFAQEEFIGSTQLDYVPNGGEIELLFGVEERIHVERELIKRDVDKARLRDKRYIRYGFEIEIENLMSSDVNLELQDQLPVSRHEDIKVRLESSEPEPSETSELNIMEWHLAIEAGEKRKIKFSYLVEHPRDLAVIGLDIS